MTFGQNSIRIWLQPWFLAGQVAKCHFGSSFGNPDLVHNNNHLVIWVTYPSDHHCTADDIDRDAPGAYYCYMKIPFPIKVGILHVMKLISWLVLILKVNQSGES